MNDALFTMSISQDLNAVDRQQLFDIVGASVTVHSVYGKRVAPGWELFVAIAKDVGTIAGSTTAIVKLATELNAWRRGVRAGGADPKAKLTAPNAGTLDLSTADDNQTEQR